MPRLLYYFLRIFHVRIVFRLPFLEFTLTICDAFSVPQVARNHQYVRSHVTNQHLCVWWIIEIDIRVHAIDEIEEITLNGKKGNVHFKHIVWLLQNQNYLQFIIFATFDQHRVQEVERIQCSLPRDVIFLVSQIFGYVQSDCVIQSATCVFSVKLR